MISKTTLYSADVSDFELAFELAEKHARQLLPEIHHKQALSFEDQGMFAEAEEEFQRAGKLHEAVEMYLFEKLWDHALRVAERCNTAAVSKVLVEQAK